MDNSEQLFNVVVNSEGHHSVWAADFPTPPGWFPTDVIANKADCLVYIEEAWKMGGSVDSLGADATLEIPATGADCIHRLFERQVARTPDAIAVFSDQRQLSFTQLNQPANRLARYLRAAADLADLRVAVCIDRCAELVAAVLGVMKSGGVYIPLEPVYPDERLVAMVRRSDVRILLTQSSLAARFSNFQGQVICIDRDQALLDSQRVDNLAEGPSSGSLSHIIFTSGSTGTPKGVMMSHAGLYRNVSAFLNRLAIQPDDVYLHTASIAFTSSMRQFLAPLCAGASIVVANAEERTNPIALFALIQRRQITIVDTVAAFWESFNHALDRLDEKSRQSLLNNRLRLILSSGGKLPMHIPENWRRRFRHPARLVNMYGQAETVGNISVYDIPESLPDELDVVPLGRPIEGVQIHLLDERLAPVPTGATGEICVGGSSFFKGYLHQPALTAEKFVPDPFSRIPGARLYRSGDLGRLRTDGSIEFVGRSDFQVKIRGFRIEPEEVEAALLKIPAVLEAVVTGRDEPGGDKRLVAYLVPEEGRTLLVSAIRRRLEQKLPDYMIPTVFVMLNSLPRLPNTKIDRAALPDPEKKRPELETSYVKPKGNLQRYLAELWRELLPVDSVGVNDRFFELGGTSLLAAQMVVRLGGDLGVSIPIVSVFEAPTIADYALLMKTRYADAIATMFVDEMQPSTAPGEGVSAIRVEPHPDGIKLLPSPGRSQSLRKKYINEQRQKRRTL